jgi:hypothetical protein
MVYGFRNHYWANNADTWVDQLGLMRVDYSPKPAYAAFKAYQPRTAVAASEPIPAEPTLERVSPAVEPTVPARATGNDPSSPIKLRVEPVGRPARTAGAGLRAGRTARISGRVLGQTGGILRIELTRRTADRRWRQVQVLKLSVDARGAFSTTFRPRVAGRWRILAEHRIAGRVDASSDPVGFRVLRARSA